MIGLIVLFIFYSGGLGLQSIIIVDNLINNIIKILTTIDVIVNNHEQTRTNCHFYCCCLKKNGFAAAARKKGVSTAAVSRQISSLEHELKTQLLKRTTRQISLTEIGDTYYQQCKRALSELQEAESAIAKSKRKLRVH